ncbi:ABCB1 [Symbiodinium natans]|uniref:ABCB1 protein n=1 Tax=Symbiodinium natans TaxID=878477 RepID=A0A812K6C6_9DINO|nr:ABCB1 [Symbiodinium natans]
MVNEDAVSAINAAPAPAKVADEIDGDEELLPATEPVKEEAAVKDKIPSASLCKLFSMIEAVDAVVLFFGVIGAAGNGLAQPLMCIVFGDLIDGMGSNAVGLSPEMLAAGMETMMTKMQELSITMCLVGLGSFVGASLQGSCFKIFAERQALKYRSLYFDAVLHQDVGWFDKKEIAALPAEINDDLEKIQDAFGDKFGNGIMSLAAFFGGFGCAFGMGWLIALVMCAILPFMGVGAMVMGQAIQEIMLESQSWYAKASAVVEECLYAMRTVVAFGGEHRELKKFSAALVHTRRGGIRNGFKVGMGMGYTMMIVFLGYALAFWFGMTLRYHDQINPATGELWNPGTIMSIFFCIFIGSFMIGNLDPSLKAMKAAQAAAGRFYSVFNSKPVIQCRLQDTREGIDSIDSFEFNDVHFTYPARPDVKVLNGLSLTIQRGQKVAFVGESGSGKSTVMALLERFYDPDSGKVLVNGTDMTSFKVSALRRCIGYVGQEPVLFASSIRNNIMQGNPEASKEDFAKACQDAQLDYVESLPDQYNTFVGAGGGQLSGGQKQRIAIARALLKKASFLFLDEATSALDNASEKMIQATIDNISSNMTEGLGIVSIAHRLSTVRNADLIYVLSRGSLVERGDHKSLMEKKGMYYALVAAQESSHKADEDENLDTESSGSFDHRRKQSTVSEESETARKAKEKQAEEEREKDIVKNYKVPMMRLLSYNKPEWPYFVPAVLGALADGASMPICTIALVGSMEGFFKTDKEAMRADLELMAIIFVIIGVSNLVAATISHGCFSILGEAMSQRLRIAILTDMFRQEVGFHDDPTHTPGMLSKALELWAFRVTVLCKSVQAKAGAMASLVVGLVIGFVYCWQMSLVMLGSIPIMVIANAIQMVVLMGASKQENSNLTNAQQIIVDSVMNARTVQALGVEKSLVSLYMGWVKKSSVGMWSRNILAGLGFGVANGIMFPVMAGGFYVASILIRDGTADFKGVMMAFMGVFYAGMGAGQAAVMAGDATKAKVACHDMFKLMDRVSQIDGLEPSGEEPKELQAGHIEFQDVKFFYPFRPEIQVLKGNLVVKSELFPWSEPCSVSINTPSPDQSINFTISAGMSVGLVGPSGGGKSTVMSLIQRFYDPQEGSVFIGKERLALSSVNIRWWRRQIGFVGQEPVLFNTTVRSNIMYGLSDDEQVSEDYVRKCEGMCNLGFLYKNGNKGLETEVGPRGSRLSGGQKQRVAICRALIRNPPVMLLDEATSALDTQSEAIVQKALEAAREGRTSFAIAHRLSTVQGCDIILVNADGRVVESGNHTQLMQQKGVYYKLQMQSQK